MYDPGADAAARFPDWVIRHRPLGSQIPEVLCRRRKVILINNAGTWPEKRCSLAHAVAHLDLGHHEVAGGFFYDAHELAANRLAARRLITLSELADALAWSRVPAEVAEELRVDLPTLRCRERHMLGGERMWLRVHAERLEASA